jgi:hypothetical protein
MAADPRVPVLVPFEPAWAANLSATAKILRRKGYVMAAELCERIVAAHDRAASR